MDSATQLGVTSTSSAPSCNVFQALCWSPSLSQPPLLPPTINVSPVQAASTPRRTRPAACSSRSQTTSRPTISIVLAAKMVSLQCAKRTNKIY